MSECVYARLSNNISLDRSGCALAACRILRYLYFCIIHISLLFIYWQSLWLSLVTFGTFPYFYPSVCILLTVKYSIFVALCTSADASCVQKDPEICELEDRGGHTRQFFDIYIDVIYIIYINAVLWVGKHASNPHLHTVYINTFSRYVYLVFCIFDKKKVWDSLLNRMGHLINYDFIYQSNICVYTGVLHIQLMMLCDVRLHIIRPPLHIGCAIFCNVPFRKWKQNIPMCFSAEMVALRWILLLLIFIVLDFLFSMHEPYLCVCACLCCVCNPMTENSLIYLNFSCGIHIGSVCMYSEHAVRFVCEIKFYIYANIRRNLLKRKLQ